MSNSQYSNRSTTSFDDMKYILFGHGIGSILSITKITLNRVMIEPFAHNGYIELNGRVNQRTPGNLSGDAAIFMPVVKGEVIKIWYAGLTTTGVFRFIYAEGEV